jgi:hypothetical protein
MGLSFTIATWLHQRSHLRVRVPRDSCPYFTASDSRFPQPGESGPRIYIPQEQASSVTPPGIGFHFCHLLRLPGLRWRYSLANLSRLPSLYNLGADHTQKTPLATGPLLLRVDLCYGNMITASLPSIDRLFFFHYCGLQPSCYDIKSMRLKTNPSWKCFAYCDEEY